MITSPIFPSSGGGATTWKKLNMQAVTETRAGTPGRPYAFSIQTDKRPQFILLTNSSVVEDMQYGSGFVWDKGGEKTSWSSRFVPGSRMLGAYL